LKNKGEKIEIDNSKSDIWIIIAVIIVIFTAVFAIFVGFFPGPPIPEHTGELHIYSTNGQYFDQISLSTYEPQGDDPSVPTIEFLIVDQDENGVEGAIVTLIGQGVAQVGETDCDGRVTISLTGVRLTEGQLSGEISVVTKKAGYQKDTTELIFVA